MKRFRHQVNSGFVASLFVVLPPGALGQDHDRFVTKPVDQFRSFTAFVLSFDGADDGQRVAVPEWVAYELRKAPNDLGTPPNRPSKWATDSQLFASQVAPSDDSYRGSGYSRGHMAMKSHAFRTSPEADRETHTVLNACPQNQAMNAGVWLSLENMTGRWADAYGKVWIVCGPVFYGNQPIEWIGDPGEVPVAVPQAFFKIIAKEGSSPSQVDVLAFLIPMYGDDGHSKQTADVTPYLVSVDTIEALTGLDFLTSLHDPVESDIEKRIFTQMWSVESDQNPAADNSTRPSRTPTEGQPGEAESRDPYAGVELRRGIEASPQHTLLAKKLKAAGWVYAMPRPKSAQASWNNSDGRTTWWYGSWENSLRGTYSTGQPSASDGFKGDGIHQTGWRRGGAPRRPTAVEWLCSTSGGVPPR